MTPWPPGTVSEHPEAHSTLTQIKFLVLQLEVVVHTCSPSTQWGLRQEDYKLQVSLGHSRRLYKQKQTKILEIPDITVWSSLS